MYVIKIDKGNGQRSRLLGGYQFRIGISLLVNDSCIQPTCRVLGHFIGPHRSFNTTCLQSYIGYFWKLAAQLRRPEQPPPSDLYDSMQFTKMHGAGNDYIYVDCFANEIPADPAALAIAISDRHKGIGGDGLILIRPSDVADGRMQMFNADGSEAEMCGNGIRCVAKYLYDHEICQNDSMKIETCAGILALELEAENGKVRQVQVDMGEPVLLASEIPTTLSGNPDFDNNVVNIPISAGGHEFHVTCVSMGNPHCVIFVDHILDDMVSQIGPKIEKDSRFPARTNVEFIEVKSPTEVRQRTWERGSGETMACGTGASAVCVAGVLTGKTERKITNRLLGGVLTLEWKKDSNHVFMTGPATEVFSGTWNGLT